MRSFYVFNIAAKQRLRDRFGLLLTVLTAPLFVVFYWMFFAGAEATYKVSILDEDAVQGDPSHHVKNVTNALKEFSSTEGSKFFSIAETQKFEDLSVSLKRGEVSVGLIFKKGFSKAFEKPGSLPEVALLGDVTSIKFQVASALVGKVIEQYAENVLGRIPSLLLKKEPLGRSAAKTPFEAYVPGLLVFAVIMLIFSSSMAVVREVESGTLARLRLTPVTSFDLLIGLSSVQLLLGVISVLLTLATASILGFKSEGSLALAMGVAGLACLASVGIGMVVASLSRTQARAFLISSVAMFLLILFSGIVFPRPEITVFTIGGRGIDLFDALPTTHMGAALGKVMTLGATFGEIVYEILFLSAIALLNYIIGGLLFIRSGKPSMNAWEGMP